MADSQLNALLAATLRTKVRPLVPSWRVPLFEGYALVPISPSQRQVLVDEQAEPDSHDDWRKLNARPPG